MEAAPGLGDRGAVEPAVPGMWVVALDAARVRFGNGAPANWRRFGLHFPKRVAVLDWYQVVEHLWAAARDRWGEDNARVEPCHGSRLAGKTCGPGMWRQC